MIVLGSGMAREIAERAGLLFHQLGDDETTESFRSRFRKLGECSSVRSMWETGRVFGKAARLLLDELPRALADESYDGLIVDQLQPAACKVADDLGLPYVLTSNALAMYWDSLLPPPPLPWGFRDDRFGRMRNLVAKSLIIRLYYWPSGQRQSKVNPLQMLFEHHHGLAKLAQQPEFFDFPREKMPPHFHYTGPWHRIDRDDQSSEFPWDWLDGRPLIYASMGTIQNRVAHVFQKIINAVKDLPMQVVLSKGGGEVSIDGDVPDNVLMVEKAPQLRLLQKASLVITHSGLNTTLECISAGVPMLCLPVTNDQPGVAKRVEWLGMGEVIPVAKVTTKKLRAKLDQMLADSSYKERCLEYQAKLGEFDGLTKAAEIAEQAFLTKRPVSST